MLAITEKSAIFKKKSFFEALQLENTYSSKSNSLQMNNAWYIINVIQDWLFGSARGWERAKKTSLLPKICNTYPTTIKLGTVLPYLKKIKKTNGQKRYQRSATFVVFRNFLMSDLKNSIFKMTFSKFKCRKNYLETSLPTWQSMFTII